MGNNTTGLDQGRVVESLQNLYEEAYVDGQNAPNGYSCNKKRDEAVAAAMASACEPGHAIAGRVILNVDGVKAISFGDEQWASLQVGDVIYSAGMGAGLGQGEPVACVKVDFLPEGASGHLVWFTPSSFEPGQELKLYTHADPGEVERLRAELVEWKERCQRNSDEAMRWMAKHDTLRAQLAEWDALLREAGHQLSDMGKTLLSEKIFGALLSASAEPSAPVERDERAAFEKAVIDKAERFHPNLEQYGDRPDADYKDASIEWAWGLWQARAALERKK